MDKVLETLRAQVHEAAATRTPQAIRGSGSKDFYGRKVNGEPLSVAAYRGVVEYEPTELVLTVRAGTPLSEVEATLAERGQCLPFEPPRFGPGATVGGCVATGLSGPRRAAAGAVRDYVLGVRIIDGRGRDLSFGGRVMKNVAGFDLARLMAGAMGTLGVLAEVSFKVLPLPRAEDSLVLEMDAAAALEALNRWGGQPLPISASFHDGRQLALRLSGAESAVRSARQKLGGETLPDAAAFWTSVREQTHPAYTAPVLWRVAVQSTTPPLALAGPMLLEWGGALRWLPDLDQGVDGATIRAAAEAAGGHATLFRGGDRDGPVFHPLAPGLAALHQRLKAAFDPEGILNPGRLYAEF